MRTSEVTHSTIDVIITRGVGPTIILITAKDPEKYAGKVIAIALGSGLEVISQKSDGNISLIMRPLKPNSNEQAELRKLLQLKSDINGSIDVSISKSK